MEKFWEGFEKKANVAAVFKGLAQKTRMPATAAQAERVLDYGAMKAAPRATSHTLDYGAMKASRSEARAVRENDAARLNYSSGKPVLEAKGAPVKTPASQATPPRPVLDARAEQRVQHATRGSTPLTDWKDALKERAS
jgi:hypothetical protein